MPPSRTVSTSMRSPPRRTERRVRAGLAAGALCGLAACDSRGTSPAPPGPTPTPQVPVAQSPAQPPPGRGAQVFVDVSESIRGFTSASAVTLQTLHAQVIDGALSQLQVNNPYQRCTVDDAVHCASPGATPQQLRNPALYRGANAALHLALRRPPRAPRPDLQQPDPLDPYRVTVVVTDGFQSTASAFQPDSRGDVACTAGADPSCLAALLRQRVDEGYGLWVGRLVLPFDGRYFAERRLDAAMWARVQAHANALNVDPQWNGVRFTASSPSMNSESGAFRWQGARPLLIFVLSRDLATGRALVADMERRARVERITRRGIPDEVVFSEWAPYEGLSAQVVNAVRNDNGGQADNVLVDRAVRTPQGLSVPVRCDIHGKARIRLDGAVAFGLLPPPPFATVTIAWRDVVANGPEFLLPREPLRAVPGGFTALTGIDCTVLPPGDRVYDFGIAARWDVNPAAMATQWFSLESAETSYEMPERVFGLADLARSVITAGVQRQGLLDRVQLRVRRN